MIKEIEQLIASGMLDQFDRYFARTLQRIAPNATPRTLILAALARKAVSNGHVCLDLERLVESSLPPGGGGLGRGGSWQYRARRHFTHPQPLPSGKRRLRGRGACLTERARNVTFGLEMGSSLLARRFGSHFLFEQAAGNPVARAAVRQVFDVAGLQEFVHHAAFGDVQ